MDCQSVEDYKYIVKVVNVHICEARCVTQVLIIYYRSSLRTYVFSFVYNGGIYIYMCVCVCVGMWVCVCVCVCVCKGGYIKLHLPTLVI